jgi:hypothetical protein
MTSIADLPMKGKYARYMRWVASLPPDAIVTDPMTGWVASRDPAWLIRHRVRQALNRRINSRGGLEAANMPIEIGLIRDARRLDDILQRRVRVYQFESELCRRRFGHLLARRDD